MAIALLGSMIVLGPLKASATSFSSAQQVPTSTNSLPIWPSVAQDAKGRIWLTYANKTLGSLFNPEIFFKTWNGITWSNPQRVINDPVDDDETPYVASLANGSMMITWSSNRTGNNVYQLFYRLYSGNTTKPSPTTSVIRLTTGTLNDTQPSVAQDRNGRIWITWSRQNVSSSASGAVFYSSIYYKYFNGTSWSPDFPLPEASNVIVAGRHQIENMPFIAQTKDGRIWIAWASNETYGTPNLYYKTTDGTLYTLPSGGIATGSWTKRATLCCNDTSASNDHPAILQARNGTIMVFWEKCAGANCLNNIYLQTSLDNGMTWTPQAAVPAASTTADERFPVAAQMSDKKIWLFWQTEGLIQTQLWYSTSDPITNVHDVGIRGLVATPSFVRSGVQWDNSGSTNVTVTVRNYGDYVENTTLTVKLNSTVLTSTPVINLAVNETRTIRFSSQTTLGFWGRYTVTAALQPVPNENTINQGDNLWSGGPVRVSPPGDVDLNGCVNIIDAALLAYSYGTKPGMPLWNPSADIDHSGAIDIIDAAWLAQYYGDCV